MRGLVSVVLALLLGRPVLASEPTVLMHDLRPYSWQEAGRFYGYAYELVREIQHELDVSAEVQLTSFNRGWQQVRQAKSTVLFPVSRSSERERLVKWVGPLIESDVYLFKRKGESLRVDSLDDLRALTRIGVQQGIRDDYVLSKLGLTNLHRSSTRTLTLRALINKRVDVIPLSENALRSLLRTEGIARDMIENTGFKLYDSVLYIAFSSDVDDETIRRWQRALDKVKSARHGELARKYLN